MSFIHHFASEFDTATGTGSSAKLAATCTLLTENESHVAASNFNTASISPSANKLIVVFTANENSTGGTAAPPTGITGAGLTFTLVREVTRETSFGNNSIWCACSASVSAGALTISHAVSKATCQWIVLELDNTIAVPADNGLRAFAQAMGVSTGGSDTNVLTNSRLSEFLFKDYATLMAWAASTKAATPMTTTGSAGFTELVDHHTALGIGWDIHASAYFKDSADKLAAITASQAAASNFKGILSAEIRTLSAGAAAYKVTAAAGIYGITGNTANLKWGKKLAAGVGSYIITGQPATMAKFRGITANAGTYLITGTAAGLKWNKKFAASVGTYVMTGTNADLERSRKLVAAVGTYSITGFAAGKRKDYIITGEGTYDINGASANLIIAQRRKMDAEPGSYESTFANAGLKYGQKLPAGFGHYSYLGFTVDLIKTQRLGDIVMSAEPGAYEISELSAGLISTTPVYKNIIYRRTRRLGTG